MKVISVLSTKGGTGKTTIATNLSVVAAKKKGSKVLLIDIDPQGSAISWSDYREDTKLTTITTPVNRLTKVLDAAKIDDVTMVIIDCPPHGDPNVAISARASSLLIVPCRPATADLQAMAATIEIVKFVDKPAMVVLNSVPARGTLVEEAREALEPTGLNVWDKTVGNRTAFIRAFAAGQGVVEFEPKGKAAEEMNLLYRHINKLIK